MEIQLKELSNQLSIFKRPILKLALDVENILSILKTQERDRERTSSEDDEEDENSIRLPCDSMEQLKKFNEKLRVNKKYKKKIVSICVCVCKCVCINTFINDNLFFRSIL